MFGTIIFAASLLCVLGNPRNLQPPRYPLESRIIGGEPVSIETVPYQLSLEKQEVHRCGAAIISTVWAITAAHCTKGLDPSTARLRSGTDILQTGGALHDVTTIIVHEKFNSFTLDYDISLILVSQPFTLSPTTATIRLANVEPTAGTASYVSGWGTTVSGGGTLPANLRGVQVPIYARDKCVDAYWDYEDITSRMVCAGLENGGKDACQGDSGGPLVANDELVGIVSWGLGCAEADYPGVYANIADLRQWIADNSGV